MMNLKKNISKSELEGYLHNFFLKVSFGRFLSDPKMEHQDAINLEIDHLIAYSNTDNVLYLFENNVVIGLIAFRESAWDSKHFGIRVAKIDYFLIDENNPNNKKGARILIESFHKWIRKNEMEMAIAKIDSSFFKVSEALQNENYIFYECITYRSLRNPGKLSSGFQNLSYRFADHQDFSQIRLIAESNTFEKSHFYLDEKFDRDKVNLMYVKWIETALESKSNTKVIVIEENNEIAGVFIYSLPQYAEISNFKFSKFEFLAVNKKFRQKGLGSRLFEAAIHSSVNEGVNIIDSTLVDKNMISQNIHEKYNFRLVNTFYTFHRWFDNNKKKK